MTYRKIHALSLTLALLLAVFACTTTTPSSSAAIAPPAAAASAGDLLSALPPSDAVIYLDLQRGLSDALPGFLATKPKALAKLNAEIDKMKVETGIDLRTFDAVAAGVTFGQRGSSMKIVLLVRGRFDSNGIINAGFAAAAKQKNSFQRQRQEEYKGKTIYVAGPATTRQPAASHTPTQNGPENTVAKTADDPRREQDQRGAITALDGNTIAAGDLESVRAAVDAGAGGTRVDDELVQLATRNTGALMGFSTKRPSALIPFSTAPDSQDPFAKILAGMQQIYGSISLDSAGFETNLSVRMETAEQARSVREMANLLKAQDSGPKGSSPIMFPDFAALLKNLNVTVEDRDVQVQLKMSLTELGPFMRGF